MLTFILAINLSKRLATAALAALLCSNVAAQTADRHTDPETATSHMTSAEHVERALPFMNSIRNNPEEPKILVDIEQIYSGIKRGYFTLADFGETPESFQTLVKNVYLADGRISMKAIHSHDPMSAFYVLAIKQHLAEKNFTLKDIGETEKSFKRASKKANIAFGKLLMKEARSTSNTDEKEKLNFIVSVIEDLNEGKYTISDIGESVDSLRKIAKKGSVYVKI